MAVRISWRCIGERSLSRKDILKDELTRAHAFIGWGFVQKVWNGVAMCVSISYQASDDFRMLRYATQSLILVDLVDLKFGIFSLSSSDVKDLFAYRGS